MSRPSLRVFICPPMNGSTPLWYPDRISEVMLKFSALAPKLETRPGNLFMMPSYPNQLIHKSYKASTSEQKNSTHCLTHSEAAELNILLDSHAVRAIYRPMHPLKTFVAHHNLRKNSSSAKSTKRLCLMLIQLSQHQGNTLALTRCLPVGLVITSVVSDSPNSSNHCF